MARRLRQGRRPARGALFAPPGRAPHHQRHAQGRPAVLHPLRPHRRRLGHRLPRRRPRAGRRDEPDRQQHPPRPAGPWDLPQGGRLSSLVSATAAFLDEARGGMAPLPAVVAAPAQPSLAALPGADTAVSSTGTGFYVGSADARHRPHVIADCDRILLADGAELSIVASDPDLDVAALYAPPGAALALASPRATCASASACTPPATPTTHRRHLAEPDRRQRQRAGRRRRRPAASSASPPRCSPATAAAR